LSWSSIFVFCLGLLFSSSVLFLVFIDKNKEKDNGSPQDDFPIFQLVVRHSLCMPKSDFHCPAS
jgi:hypothetical protein